MSPAKIKYYIAISGSSQSEIANLLNVNPQSVHKVIHRIINSKRIAKKLSDITGISVNELFPDGRYEKAA